MFSKVLSLRGGATARSSWLWTKRRSYRLNSPFSVLHGEKRNVFASASAAGSDQGGSKSGQFSSTWNMAVVVAAAAMGGYLMPSQKTSLLSASASSDKPNTTKCDASSLAPMGGEPTTSFQVLTALEMKDEVQRVRFAQILHDLHELAKEQRADEPVQEAQPSSRNLWDYSSTSGNSSRHSDEDEAGKLGPDFFLNICKEDAQTMIGDLFQGGKFEESSLLSLLAASDKLLRQDPTLVDLRKDEEDENRKIISVVGDLHGSLSALQNSLELAGTIGRHTDEESGEVTDRYIVFSGDIVDRGNESLEVLCILLLLKLAHPEHVVLVRGNHEDVLIASAYGFHDELMEKYDTSSSSLLWDAINQVFCALPVCVVTDTAAIMHGGLPSSDFSLEDVQAISTEERCSVKSPVEPTSEMGRLLQGLLWSDPITRPGVHPNTNRSVGVFYGPDVVLDFLKRHNLKYIIRGHEVAEDGTNIIDCDEEGQYSVITVFSQPSYPNGEGNNLGAVVQLDQDGNWQSLLFADEEAADREQQSYLDTLYALMLANRLKLEKNFQVLAPDGLIRPSAWGDVMADTLELADVPWATLIPFLVPTQCTLVDHNDTDDESEWINWRNFLDALHYEQQDDDHNMEELRSHHQMLLKVFKFLDFDGNGHIDADEFRTGTSLLNRRLPQDRQLKDIEGLFQRIDADGNGVIDLDEFADFFKTY